MRILADGRKFFIDHSKCAVSYDCHMSCHVSADKRSTQWEDPRLNKPSSGNSVSIHTDAPLSNIHV